MRIYEKTECQYHPGRPARKAKGLCQVCYARIKRNTDPKWREASKKAKLRYRLKHPEKERLRAARNRRTVAGLAAKKRARLKERYGLTIEQHDQLKIQQNNQCALCDRVMPLHIDHCHKTGQVRGLLCRHCNSWLGYFETKHTTVERTIEYIKNRAPVP